MISARLFDGRGRSGNSAQLIVPHRGMEARNINWLRTRRLNDRVSSLDLQVSQNESNRGIVFLFEHPNYKGRFQAFQTAPGTELRDNSLNNERFDNITSSVLIVRRPRFEHIIPFEIRSFLQPHVNRLGQQMMNEVAASSKVKRAYLNGNPTIDWDISPNFAPGRQLINIKIRFRIDPKRRVLRKRDITVNLWFSFHVLANGCPAARLDHWTVSADRGFIRKARIERPIRAAVARNENLVNSLLSLMVRPFCRTLLRNQVRVQNAMIIPATSSASLRSNSLSSWRGQSGRTGLYLILGTNTEL